MTNTVKPAELFTKAMFFTSDKRPPTQGFVVFQDRSGWFYLKKLVEREGLKTPFTSIEEIEMFLGEKLTLAQELKFPDKPKENDDG